jgi:hypothetical protein
MASQVHQPRGAHLVNSLPHLQGAIKRDPASYVDDFALQWHAYDAFRLLAIQGIAGQGSARRDEEQWRDLVTFLSQASSDRRIHSEPLLMPNADLAVLPPVCDTTNQPPRGNSPR